MLFPTITFAIFFMIVLPVSWLLMPRRRRWKLFMLSASYFFYGYWNWRFVFLIAASSVANQLFARAIHDASDDRKRRLWLTAAVVANLGVLGVFKYYDFFVTEAANVLDRVGVGFSPELLAVTLPVGISFFTFQALSYVIDVYRGTFKPGRLIDFAVFLSFFPHVVAGPIVRPAEFLPQLKQRHDPRKIDASRAFFLIFIGLFKKVVIANVLASEIVDTVFASPKQHSGLEILVGIYAYAVQIYADFSGYTDMAIAIALLLGIVFPQNFDRPYAAVSLQEFWRRWHMTLSRWLRDYLYIPLGGNRGTELRTYVNLMLTMLLGGLWHGANWTFVVWGGIHGVGLVAERMLARGEAGQERAAQVWRWLLTLNVVCLAWVFFRAESVDVALDLLERMVTAWGASPLVTPLVVLTIAGMLALQFVPPGWYRELRVRISYAPAVAQAVVFALALVLVDALGPEGVAPFIYFQF
jgi:D-alanyl-lipoteichoic acid acyltransferase DltB (MBOAT superfamily)